MVRVHAANVCGEGRPGTSAHDNGRHHHAHFPHHCDADEIRDVNAGSEIGKLNISHKCENHPDKETNEGDDG